MRTCSATKPPASDPTEKPTRITVQASAPPSDSFATTAPSTTKNDVNMFPNDAESTTTHTHVREENSCHPSRRSLRKDCGGSFTCGGRRSSERKNALNAKLAASTASAQPGPPP